jgi:hypothetical protein
MVFEGDYEKSVIPFMAPSLKRSEIVYHARVGLCRLFSRQFSDLSSHNDGYQFQTSVVLDSDMRKS